MEDIKDYFYELEVEPVFENQVIKFRGLCARYRMNLLAVSNRDKNIMFVAMSDTICVYRLSLLNDVPDEPFKILKRPAYSEHSQQDHIINAIKVDKIGNEEVLVSVDEAGDVYIWFTASLDKNPIQLSNNESTWGIAMHGPKRLLAVSANSHEITIFNLQKSVQFFNEFDEDDDSDSSEEEEPQKSKTYASVLTKISDNDALGGGKAVSVLRGHEHNIPNICFSACGRFLVSCSIDATCRVWNVKTGELIQTKLLNNDYDDWNFYDNDEEWGWTANFVPKSAFKTVSSNCERCRPNSSSLPSSPRSVETTDSLNLYRQHLRYNLDGQGANLQGAEDLYRIIISRNLRFGNREYEDGFIEDGAYFENDYGTEEELNEGDPELESNEDDTEEESNNIEERFIIEDDEISFHPSRNSPNRERSVMETEGNTTPAYYDRADSATPVVENYTENNPDYRWSVGHELSIVNNNNEQNDENDSSSVSEEEIEKDHDGESPKEITEKIPSQLAQSNTCTVHGSSSSPTVQPSCSLSQTTSEYIASASSNSNNPNFSPETSVSPTYSPVSPEYVPTNQESSPPQSSMVESIISDLQQESLLPSPNKSHDSSSNGHEPQSSMDTVNTSIDEEHLDITNHEDVGNLPPLPSSSRGDINDRTIVDSSSRIPDISNNQNSHDRFHIHHKRIEPLGSSQSDCCPNLGLPDELVLYTSKHDLFILDPKSNLKVLHAEKDIVRKVDSRHFAVHSFDRLNMVEVIPELSLIIVASQQGKVALTRLIKIVDDNDNEHYFLRPETYVPPTQMTSPLLGMFVVKHDTFQEPALHYYRLYLIYCSGMMYCYEIRRKKETNPLRMDNILI